MIGQDAQDDILNAWSYYEGLRPGLGDLFEDELDIMFGQISERPKSFQVVYDGKRRAILKRFKFNVFFNFEGSAVQILAVMHSSRNPDRWQKR